MDNEKMDDILKDFVNEAREHLETIEADLLAIEEGGAAIDEQLVNKVFRAAHSIKGGSGFFGLDKVKELAHKAETVLDLVRSRKLTPNAEVTNVLLAAFDKLREMINSAAESNRTDIADLVAGLVGLASSYLPKEQKSSLTAKVTFKGPGGCGQVTLFQSDLDRARGTGLYVYCVSCDLIEDFEKAGIDIHSLFKDISACGEILECFVDYDAVGTLDDPIGKQLPVSMVVATVIEPGLIDGLLKTISSDRIHLLFDPHKGIMWPATSSALPQDDPAPQPSMPSSAKASTNPVASEAQLCPETPADTLQTAAATAVAKTAPSASGAAASTAMPGTSANDTLRVNVGLLDTLMNLAGELVLSRNQLRAAVTQGNSTQLAAVDQRVNQVTSELQDVIMQTRLQPIGNVFSKFPRVVRDMARTMGKEIELDIRGKDVAMDKTMIECLSDPLSHMVRNAVDHGVETAEERVRAGKKPAGHIRIEARHEAGMVVVEIADDGNGIDGEKVVNAAIRKGLITAEKTTGLSARDKQALIFLPGLSTAQKVTDVSGRGVGMDVVKTNLDRLGGQVEIVSEIGKGSTFRIKLPLTLAIIPSLIVSVENERFAIPQANIEELLRLRPEELKSRIEIVGDSEVLLLRDRVLPLARFADIIGAMPTYIDPATGRRELDRRSRLADRRSPRYALDETAAGTGEPALEPLHQRRAGDRRQAANSALEIAVVTTGTMPYALAVGAFHDTEEVVVKPLGRRFKKLREYAGATILGDGTVALILDITGLAAKAGLNSVNASARAAELAAAAEAERLQDLHSLLLFENGPGEHCAVPLNMVQRIERITPQQVERLGAHRTMQYRGGSLPLVTLADTASVASVDGRDELVVLVSNARGREVGLLGAMPVDVIETPATIDQVTHRQKGIAGSSIIRNATTLIADLYELVDQAYPEWATEQKATRLDTPLTAKTGADSGVCTVLLAEDSDFFRAQLKKCLEEDGFQVLAAPDGEAAWELLLKNTDKVRVVVTDIEMPHLDGLGLAARIRGDERTARLPIIAVTSLAGDEDAEKGKAAGIDEYQVKLDREKLSVSVRKWMA